MQPFFLFIYIIMTSSCSGGMNKLIRRRSRSRSQGHQIKDVISLIEVTI